MSDQDFQDHHFTVTRFNPEDGILFKYGRGFQNRARQISKFQEAVGIQLPRDFVEMIGDYCEGGFDGHYLVYQHEGVELYWSHLLLMKIADEHDTWGHDTLKLIRENPHLFGNLSALKLFPFGEAFVMRSADDSKDGYLAFDLSSQFAVVFVTEGSERPIPVADSFRNMMLGSGFVFYG